MIPLKLAHRKWFEYLLKNPYTLPNEFLLEKELVSSTTSKTNLTDFAANLTAYLQAGNVKLVSQRLTPSVTIHIARKQFIVFDNVIIAHILPDKVLISEAMTSNPTVDKFKHIIKRWAKTSNLSVQSVPCITISVTFDTFRYQRMVNGEVGKPLIIKGLLFNQ